MITPGNIFSTRYSAPFRSTQQISMIVENAHGKKYSTMILCSTRSNDAFKISHMIRGLDLTAQSLERQEILSSSGELVIVMVSSTNH